MPTVPITVAYGDGIGPEIMEATLHILKEGGAKLAIENAGRGVEATDTHKWPRAGTLSRGRRTQSRSVVQSV